MRYADPVEWAELQEKIREGMKAAPRGYKKELAATLNVTQGYVSHIATGLRQIPPEHIDAVLKSLNLTLDLKQVQPREAE